MNFMLMNGLRSRNLFSNGSLLLSPFCRKNLSNLLLYSTLQGKGFQRNHERLCIESRGIDSRKRYFMIFPGNLTSDRRIPWNWYPDAISNIHSTCNRYTTPPPEPPGDGSTKKLSIFKRFKAMYRDYWYVLVPVHLITSAVWFGVFYYMASSGVDIADLMSHLNLSESILEKIKKNSNSVPGYLAVSYILYKIFTPLRYTVTLGGTTVSINYLKKWGYIKPMPKKEELKKMFQDRKESIRTQTRMFKERRDKMKKTVLNKLSANQRGKNLREKRDNIKRSTVLSNKKN